MTLATPRKVTGLESNLQTSYSELAALKTVQHYVTQINLLEKRYFLITFTTKMQAEIKATAPMNKVNY